jgi:hypothetical protein
VLNVGDDAEIADADALVGLMLDWYVSERADDVDLSADGDMLLFQWGTYDRAKGPIFQYDITRQLLSNTSSRAPDLSATADDTRDPNRLSVASTCWCSGTSSRTAASGASMDPVERHAGCSIETLTSPSRSSVTA